MEDLKKIVWIASYPKSGNTWFRVLLTNLIRNPDKPASINELIDTPIASGRELFDELTGVASSDLSMEEIELLRPEVYKYLARQAENNVYLKIHDAYTNLSTGEPLIPPEITKAVIYLIRNPLDVVCSFAHHSNCTIDTMIQGMNDPNHSFCSRNDRLFNQLQQRLLTWSNHVRSWVDAPDLPVLVVRYEDMIADCLETFKKAVKFVPLDYDFCLIEKAVIFSQFSELKKQETELGFREKSPAAESFFRKGKTGSWQDELTSEQVKQIIKDHGEVMKRFGYI